MSDEEPGEIRKVEVAYTNKMSYELPVRYGMVIFSPRNYFMGSWIKKNRDAPDTVFAGYPANPKAGYRISGKGRILGFTTIFLVQYQINL
jgi:hypothetical protein